MARICVLGGGVCGLATAMMLARDGHEVTVFEKDGEEPPESPEEAWEAWERKGVAQFRQPHNLHARVRHILQAELPEVLAGLREANAHRMDPLDSLPPFIADRAPRAGDDRFWTLTGRRAVVESVFARAAREEPRLELVRGERVLGLTTGASAVEGVPHVTGIETETRGAIGADLVVDAMGRQSKLADWIAAAGGKRPREQAEDCQFTYYSRFYASPEGGVPQMIAPILSPFATYAILTLPADNNHWSVTIAISNADQAMKRLRATQAWEAFVSAHPLHKHWLDGLPASDVLPLAGVLDRRRWFVVDGAPVATGVAAVADAWACTNPQAGRGIAVGMLHAVRLRDVVREHLDAPARFAEAWDETTERDVAPWFDLQVRQDRAYVAAMNAEREGRPAPAPEGERAQLEAAFQLAAVHDADLFRGFMEVVTCQTLPEQVLARPGMAERALAVAKDKTPVALPAPPREELLALLA
ncbi:MAG TPA: NAD(P)-binding protein [Dehalococcoidia bacterium]|nr:NAD(P)-binding protein [Dehalococcoidia bacterium]